MRRKGFPEINELVVCKITKINPNSAFAEIVEYNKTGMIHVSEVAKRWVRNIREFLKENQYVVCKVMDVKGDVISLSIKRVGKEQANRVLNEFKKEKRAEKMLEIAAKELKKNLDQAYEEVGYKLLDYFGSLTKSFEIALKNEDLLRTKGLPENWIKVLVNIAKKSYSEKIYEVKVKLKLICYAPNGIEIIKNILKKTNGFEIKYISASNYVLIGKGNNYKKLEAKAKEVSERIVKEINKNQGEGSFVLEK